MNKISQIRRVDLKELKFQDILSDIERSGKPFIITKNEKGIAAIIPYVDLNDIKSKKPAKEKLVSNMI